MTLSFWNNGNDTVIAESAEDAAKVWEETFGGSWEEFVQNEESDAEWELENLPERLTLNLEEEDDARKIAPDGAEIEHGHHGYWMVKATRQQWIDKLGRSFFGSDDW